MKKNRCIIIWCILIKSRKASASLMKKTVALFFVFLVFSCQNDSDSTVDESPITSYYFTNMHYPQNTMISSTESNQVRLEYNSAGKIIKRLGGVRVVDPATGFSNAYSSEISDDLIYSDHTILIEEGRILPFYPDPSTRTKILLDNSNRMLQRINIKDLPIYQTSLDTVKYTYNSAGLLIESKKGKQTSEHEIAQYYYNPSKNLDSIVTKNYMPGNVVFYKIKETFDGYDAAVNPMKKLFLFKETFLRSLSQNNYMHYEKNQYDFDNNLVNHEERNWTIPHDANGEILFDSN